MSLKIVLKNQRFFAPRKVVSQFFGHEKNQDFFVHKKSEAFLSAFKIGDFK